MAGKLQTAFAAPLHIYNKVGFVLRQLFGLPGQGRDCSTLMVLLVDLWVQVAGQRAAIKEPAF